MRYFANPSPFARYMADSSYWLYIVHLPILCQINVLVAQYRWHWLPKTLFYTAVAFAIMMPSYHYLVRSTWLGKTAQRPHLSVSTVVSSAQRGSRSGQRVGT